MKYIFTSLFFIFICLNKTLACPNLAAKAEDVLKVPADVLEGNGLVKKVYAKNEFNIMQCNTAKAQLWDMYGDIYFPKTPSIQIDISYLGGYYLTFESNANCESFLLVVGPYGGGSTIGTKDITASFSNPQDGMYSIWAGTKGTNDCEISITTKASF